MNNDIRNALNAIPVPDDLGKSVEAGVKRAESERRNIIMKKGLARKAAIAAACAAVILAASFTAVAAYVSPYTKDVMRNKAYGAALEFAVAHADSEEQSQSIAEMLIGGLDYDRSAEESSVNFGLDGLAPIYNVGFKVAGFEYDIHVDAKTFEVVSYERNADEGWEEHLLDVENSDEMPSAEPLTPVEAQFIAQDWFGLYDTANCGDGSLSASVYPEKKEMNVEITHGGYIYQCAVDSETGEVSKASITEEKGKKSDRHRHEPSGEYIGLYRANRIVLEEYSLKYSPYDYFNGENMYYMALSFIAKTQTRGDKTFESGYGTDVYSAVLQRRETSIRAEIVIDAKTGEVISNKVVTE